MSGLDLGVLCADGVYFCATLNPNILGECVCVSVFFCLGDMHSDFIEELFNSLFSFFTCVIFTMARFKEIKRV